MLKINRLTYIVPVFFTTIFTILSFVNVPIAKAEDFLILEQIQKNSTENFTASSTSLGLQVFNGTFESDIWVKMTNIVPKQFIGSYFQYPEEISPLTDLFSIRFPQPSLFSKQPKVSVKFPKGDKAAQLYFYNWGQLRFEKAVDAVKDMENSVFTFDYPNNKEFLMFAVFGNPYHEGKASWYVHPRYRGELMAASTIYPKGTSLKVINTANNKEVTVIVKDYGPDPVIHPDRVIDLSKEAFAKIANTSAGIINVTVTKID